MLICFCFSEIKEKGKSDKIYSIFHTSPDKICLNHKRCCKSKLYFYYSTIETRCSMHLARLLRKRLKKKTDRTKRKALSKVKLDEKIPF